MEFLLSCVIPTPTTSISMFYLDAALLTVVVELSFNIGVIPMLADRLALCLPAEFL